jgi:N-acetylglucosamine kinase-like BadF-type ATPase
VRTRGFRPFSKPAVEDKGTILAIDQGGSKTVALVSDASGNILGVGTGFGSCHFVDGLEKAMKAVSMAAGDALQKAGLSYADVACVSAGLAGANWPDEFELLENALRKISGVQNITVYNDCLIAMRGGTDNPDAVVLCGGSGLNCAVTTGKGVVRVYNNYVDDLDQGGGSLGARALLAVFQSEIGILPPTALRERSLKFFGYTKVDDLLLAYQRKQLKKPLKEFTFELFDIADGNDTVALGVIHDFGVSLSRYVAAGAKTYGLVGLPFDVVLSGGIFKAKNTLLPDTICSEVHRTAPGAKIVNADYEPIVGALIMGLEKALGGDMTQEIHANCRKSAADAGLMRMTEDSRSGFFSGR